MTFIWRLRFALVYALLKVAEGALRAATRCAPASFKATARLTV